MLLESLLQNLQYEIIQGHLRLEINTLQFDSRKVKNNDLFFAIPGFTVDGHDFIDQAVDNGAIAVIVEKEVTVKHDIAVIKVSNARNAMARISVDFYNKPTDSMNLIGITGTNGKTSITYLLKSIFEAADKNISVIGTNGNIINNKLMSSESTTPTTPESLHLQKLFYEMKKSEVTNCIMEVSSHALDLDRVTYSNFSTGIFTNLSPDHLEFHQNIDNYFDAKCKLFKQTSQYNIINIDDKYGRVLYSIAKKYKAKIITYGLNNEADIYPTDMKRSLNGTQFIVNTPTGKSKVQLNLPGDMYVLNCLAAIACAYSNQIPLDIIVKGIRDLKGIKGRFDVVYEKKDFKVIIDFAHTEDALEKTLKTIKPFAKGRVILVFGVYADESESGSKKRYGMGKVAAKHADYSIITLDNPKHHDQDLIITEISQAMDINQGKYESILDRKMAIQTAIRMSKETDIILIAGKGHETSQVIGDVSIPFNETEIVLDTIESDLSHAIIY